MKYMTGVGLLICLFTVLVGVFFYLRPIKKNAAQLLKAALTSNGALFVLFLVVAFVFMLSGNAAASEATDVAVESSSSSDSGLGYIAAALATGMATIGAGLAVGSVGSSALGAVSEDPKILGKTLIFVGLAEGIAIYGLIVSILILGRL